MISVLHMRIYNTLIPLILRWEWRKYFTYLFLCTNQSVLRSYFVSPLAVKYFHHFYLKAWCIAGVRHYFAPCVFLVITGNNILCKTEEKLLHWRAKLSGLDSSGTSSKLRNKFTFIFKQLFLEIEMWVQWIESNFGRRENGPVHYTVSYTHDSVATGTWWRGQFILCTWSFSLTSHLHPSPPPSYKHIYALVFTQKLWCPRLIFHRCRLIVR